MNCPHRERVLQLGAGPLNETERRTLRRHAESCSVCLQALDTISAAREVLKNNQRTPHPSARVRVWARIESERQQAHGSRYRWAMAAVAASLAAALVFAYIQRDFDTTPRVTTGVLVAEGRTVGSDGILPERSELIAKSAATIKTGNAAVSLSAGTTLRVAVSEPHIELMSGELWVSPLGTTPTVVQTSAVRLTVLAGRVAVRADDERTLVQVEPWARGG